MTTNLKKISQSIKSMKEQMKITENEKIYRLKNFKSNDVREDYSKCFKCTKCDKSFKSIIDRGKEVSAHPLLEVLMCSSCCDYYGDGNFSMGSDDEDKYCRWCGEGGILFSCSKCVCGFCNQCIKKHFGEEILEKIEKDDDWQCYFCNPTPLWFLRAVCSLAKEISENKKEEKKINKENKSQKRKRTKVQLSKGCLYSLDDESERMDLNEEDSDDESTIKLRKSSKKRKNDKIDPDNPPQNADDTKFDESEKNIVLKFGRICKITELLMEIGLRTIGESFRISTQLNETVDNIKELQKEYTRLKIVLNTIRSYLDKSIDTFDSFQHDFENANGEGNAVFAKNDEFEKSLREKIEAELKKINSVEIVKPILKVKSFAKMTTDNLLNPKNNDCSAKISQNEIADKKNSETKIKQTNFDEYNKETDESSGENSLAKRQSNTSSESTFSTDESYKTRKRSKKKLRQTFENFRQKRKNYIKKNCRRERVGKNEEIRSRIKNAELNSSDENCCSTNKKNKSSKLRIIESSDEEEKEDEHITRKEKFPAHKERNEENLSSDESDSSSKSSNFSSNKLNCKNKRKLRKIKRNSDSSSSEDEENDKIVNKSRQRRRNIRKILKKEFLQLDTKEAVKYEEERQKRLQEREKLFEELFLTATQDLEADKQLILDYDEETKEPLVTVHKNLVKKLKPHQLEGIKFMWNNCFESVKRLETDRGTGCILAHCMGFGKTVQVITLIHTLMNHNLGVHTVLIICPFGIISTWINEFRTWLKDVDSEFIDVYDLLKIRNNTERSHQIEYWNENGGIMILSYDLFRNLTKSCSGARKKIFKSFEKALLNPGPDLVICDEGHLLKNSGSTLSKCISQIKTTRRIVLTGTPLQNNLLEYYCMMQFVKPNFLGSKNEFSNRFINPIVNGQFEDSTEQDVKLMKHRSHVLHSMLKGCVQRFGFSILASYLPEKKEFVLLISMTNAQINAYNYFIETLSGRALKSSKVTTLFNDFHYLQRIWTHPRALLIERNYKSEQTDSEGSLKDFIVHTDEEESTLSSSDEKERTSSVEEIGRSSKSVFNANHVDKVQGVGKEVDSNTDKFWWEDFFFEKDFEDIHTSNKLLVLFSLLNMCGRLGEKVLVFSQSLNSLDIIEYFLNKVDESCTMDNTSSGTFQDSWILGIDYFRLDGSTSNDTRTAWCRNFNMLSNKRARLFLISTKAGGLGINLSSANRVVIFDASWNPSNDLQSIFRIYRFGQKKKCYVYRFLAEGTMEEKIYKRQITKLSLAERVVDEHQIERHYSVGSLQDLYKFEPMPQEKRKTPNLPQDDVLAELLSIYKDAIVAYHEQDSLLENKEEEELSEQEKQRAWQDYNEEKLSKNIANINFSENLGNISLMYQPNFLGNYIPNVYSNPFNIHSSLLLNFRQ